MKIFTKQPFLIAEIGVNFYDIAQKEEISDMDAAKLMIDEAKSCGVNAVKFQSFKVENLVSKNSDAFLKNMINLEKRNIANLQITVKIVV